MSFKSYIIPLVGLGFTVYGALHKSTAVAAPATTGVTMVALPDDAVIVTTIKDVSIYNSSEGYFAEPKGSPLAMPLTGSNATQFVNQLYQAKLI